MFHKILNIKTLPDYRIIAHFENGADRLYDMGLLMDEYPVLLAFKNIPGLFEQAKVDVGGYGIVWNEDIDIDAEEVYQNGVEVSQTV